MGPPTNNRTTVPPLAGGKYRSRSEAKAGVGGPTPTNTQRSDASNPQADSNPPTPAPHSVLPQQFAKQTANGLAAGEYAAATFPHFVGDYLGHDFLSACGVLAGVGGQIRDPHAVPRFLIRELPPSGTSLSTCSPPTFVYM